MNGCKSGFLQSGISAEQLVSFEFAIRHVGTGFRWHAVQHVPRGCSRLHHVYAVTGHYHGNESRCDRMAMG